MTVEADEKLVTKKPGRGWRWIRRALVSIVSIYAIHFARLEWNAGSEIAAFEKRIADYRSAGYPATISDLQALADAAGSTSAETLDAAARLVDEDEGVHGYLIDLPDQLPLREDDLRAIESTLTPLPQVRTLLRRATTQPAAEWRLKYTTPIIEMLQPSLNLQRELSRFLRVAQLRALDRGDLSEALESVEEQYLIAEAFQRYPTAIGMLVSVGIRCQADECLARFLAVAERNPDEKALRTRYAALRGRLLDERSVRPDFGRTAAGEIVQISDTLKFVLAGGKEEPGPWQRFNLRAARGPAHRGATKAIDRISDILSASLSPDWPSFSAKLPPVPAGSVDDDKIATLFFSSARTFDRNALYLYETIARRRLAATAIAIRLYALDHENQRPPTLGALVPSYLAAIPPDPMAVGQPILYVTDGPFPCVYSVGRDGVDDKASEYRATRPLNLFAIDDGPVGSDYKGDIVFYLGPRPRDEETEKAEPSK